jgi:hypothetical protein
MKEALTPTGLVLTPAAAAWGVRRWLNADLSAVQTNVRTACSWSNSDFDRWETAAPKLFDVTPFYSKGKCGPAVRPIKRKRFGIPRPACLENHALSSALRCALNRRGSRAAYAQAALGMEIRRCFLCAIHFLISRCLYAGAPANPVRRRQ